MHLPATEKAIDEHLSRFVGLALFGLAAFLLVGAARILGVRDMATVHRLFVTSSDLYSPSWVTEQNATHQRQEQAHAKPPLKAADYINDRKRHLLLAATGSVATIKIPNMILALSKHNDVSIRVLLTKSATEFLNAQSAEQPSLNEIAAMKNVDGIYLDEDEWRKPWVRGDSILHIELRRWADLMVIAPLSANSLAKIANGFSDSLLTSVVRAWDTTGLIDTARPEVPLPYGDKKGIIAAPAMNTAMWNHPVTAKHMHILQNEWGIKNGGWFEMLRPVEKELACGDTGSGAMRSWDEIVAVVEQRLHLERNEEKDKSQK